MTRLCMPTLQLWWLGLPDARRPCVSRGSCTYLEQSSISCQRCAISSIILEPPEDMAFWTDDGGV